MVIVIEKMKQIQKAMFNLIPMKIGSTPKVVIFKTPATLGSPVTVYDKTRQRFITHALRTTSDAPTPPRLNPVSSSNLVNGSITALSDQNSDSSVTFNPEGVDNTIEFTNLAAKSITGFTTKLDNNSLYPKRLSVRAYINQQWVPIII